MANRRRPKFMGVWLSEAGHERVEQRAAEAKTSKSEMVRRLLAYAVLRMPKEWKP